VRNRKTFFINTFLKLFHEQEEKFSLLNIASGPCRDLAEALEQTGYDANEILIYCVDMDKDAIAYAKGLLNGSASKTNIQWEAANAFKIRPSMKFDLTWSAGLFDYLEDRFAIALIKRMWGWTKDGGTMIFGNFHPRNPSRNYMEWCGAWFLIHRTEKEMIKLCKQGGIPAACIRIEQEPLGVNLFCVAQKG
jgi:SAM-dependent methyltransferase